MDTKVVSVSFICHYAQEQVLDSLSFRLSELESLAYVFFSFFFASIIIVPIPPPILYKDERQAVQFFFYFTFFFPCSFFFINCKAVFNR